MQGEIDPLPSFPEPLKHVWWCFSQLAGTRPVGPVIGPITYAEIAAFNQSTQAALSARDVRLIRQIDERVRAVALGVFDPTPKAQRRGLSSFLRQKAEQSRKRKAKGDSAVTP